MTPALCTSTCNFFSKNPVTVCFTVSKSAKSITKASNLPLEDGLAAWMALIPVSTRVSERAGVQLSVVTDGTPEKGRRYHTFSHTERALVATFDLSDHINQNIWSICYVYTRGHTDIQTHRDIYT